MASSSKFSLGTKNWLYSEFFMETDLQRDGSNDVYKV